MLSVDIVIFSKKWKTKKLASSSTGQLTILQLTNKQLPVAIQLNVNGVGNRCLVSQAQLAYPQCLAPLPPSYCCEPIWGEVAASLRVGPNEVMVGGSFSKDGVLTSSNTMSFGYQNLMVARIPPATAPYGMLDAVVAATMAMQGAIITGGPNGPVLDLFCSMWLNDDTTTTPTPTSTTSRCTKVLVAGKFTEWQAFALNEPTGKEFAFPIVIANQSALVLTYNNTSMTYVPGELLGPDAGQTTLSNNNVNNDQETVRARNSLTYIKTTKNQKVKN